jgi:hypothetical protein
MQESHTNYGPLLVSDDDIVIGQFGVIGGLWLLEVSVKCVGFFIVVLSDIFARDVKLMSLVFG